MVTFVTLTTRLPATICDSHYLMEQFWNLIDLDRQCSIPLNDFNWTLNGIFWGKHANLLKMFCWPVKCHDIMEDIENNWSIIGPQERRFEYPKSKIELLPVDIYLCIFDTLHVTDAISLAITCWALWASSKRTLPRKLELAMRPPCAKNRLICVGHCVSSDDVPPGILNENQLAAVTATGGLYYWSRNFRRRTMDHYPCVLETVLLPLRYQDRRIFMALAAVRMPERNVVIRNYSKLEYIRESGLKESPSIGSMGIAQALLSRICWSSDPSSGMGYKGDIHRGTWAGDEIEIMCEDRFNQILTAGRQNPPGKTWKDITEESVQLLVNIWNADTSL